MKDPRLHKTLFTGAVVFAGSLVLSIFLVSCQKAACSSCNFSQMSAGGSSNSNSSASTTTSGTFTLSLPANMATPVANLGTQFTVPVTVTADSNYNGTVDLSVVEPELQQLDPGKGITFSFDKPSVTLTPGASATVMVTVNVTTMAPSFATASMFHVQAADSNQGYMTSVQVPLKVKAEYDVFMYGPQTAGQASPEKWSLAVGQTVGFIAHSEGLTVNFYNMDSSVHLVHSSGGPIPHESTSTPYAGTNIIGLPPSPDGGKTPGGVYSNVVTPQMTGSSQVYCHDHENGGQSRTLQFNLPVPMPSPTPTPTPNPNAKFSIINTNILQAKCVSCHNVNNMSGNVSLDSYNAVLNAVVKGNAAASPLYAVVAPPNPSMPKGGTPLSTAEVQEIQDWINSGAPNN